MSAVARLPRRDRAAASALAAAGFAGGAVAVVAGGRAVPILAVAAGSLFLAALAVRRPALSWEHLLAALVLVILFIPIRRYRVPGDLPFQLEPYRILVGVILAGWVAALLADPRVRLRRSGLEGPVALIVLTTVLSVVVNPERLRDFQPTALKALTFLLSFIVVFYVVVSIVRTRATADVLAKVLVAGGAVLAGLAILESRTGVTPFTQLDAVLPFLTPDPAFQSEIARGARLRAFASAEHPIALGAALVLLVPLAVYVARVSSSSVWYGALGALVLGVFATVSRTGILMLAVIAVVFLCLRPRETRRFWPALVPLLVIIHFAVPGTLGSLKQAFFPEGGLIQEQRSFAESCAGAGRIADIAPTLDEVGKKPVLGYGYGTRIVTGPDANACILDNQWLGTVRDVGIAGFAAWVWFFMAVLVRLGGPAKRDESPTGWLLVAVTASVMAYAVGMFTYDAFGFSQVTFLLFILLGLGAGVGAAAKVPQLVART